MSSSHDRRHLTDVPAMIETVNGAWFAGEQLKAFATEVMPKLTGR